MHSVRLKTVLAVIAVLLLTANNYASAPNLANYQGRLTDATNTPLSGTYSIKFTIYDDSTTTASKWTETHSSVTVTDGLFSVLLGSVTTLEDSVFNQSDRFLGVKVGTDAELAPRVRLVTSPYAFRVNTIDGATGGVVSGDVTIQSDISVSGKSTIGPGHTNTGLFSNVAGFEGIVSNDYATVGGGIRNVASGRDATVGGGRFNEATNLNASVGGGIDNEATGEFSVISGGGNNKADAWSSSIGGGSANFSRDSGATVAGGALNVARGKWSFIGGGGTADLSADTNYAEGDWSIIVGGFENYASGLHAIIGGGEKNLAGGRHTTVSGGLGDTATGWYNTISGGQGNNTSNNYSTVSGGGFHIADGFAASVGGGYQNTASGDYATVPGGQSNRAFGNHSFASGFRAVANHDATFVWADDQNADFMSTGTDQFLIRAAGGVGIGTNNPNSPLEVAGVIHSTAGGVKFPDGTVQTTAGVGDNDWMIDGADIYSFLSGNVGVGTSTPAAKLHVDGTLRVTGGGTNFKKLTLDFEPGGFSVFRVYDNNTQDDFRFSTTTDSASWLAGPGNVGIGTKAPLSKLHVQGDLQVSGASGNSAVVLPADAISADEILDEPGVAQATATNQVDITGGYLEYLTVSLNQPTSGWVIVTATAELTLRQDQSSSLVEFGVSNAQGVLDLDQRKQINARIRASGQSLNRHIVSAHKAFQVGPGQQDFYIIARNVDGNLARIEERTITALYVPTQY